MFISKSARNIPELKNSELIKKVIFCLNKKVFWYGDFLFNSEKISDLYLMNEFDEAKIIIEAKSVLMTKLNVKILCTCSNYQIPLIWYHKILTPGMWSNYFNLILIGNFNFIDIWREVCKIV